MVELLGRQNLLELRVRDLGVSDAASVGARFAELVDSDPATELSVEWDRDRFVYRSWSVLAPQAGARVLLLFGNPTANSLNLGSMFAMEKGGGVHRVWRVLRAVGALPPSAPSDAARLNDLVADDLMAVPGGLALGSFASFPTPTAGPYAGMAGVRRLLGSAAFRNYLRWESDRWTRAWSDSECRSPSTILAFQKDAFEAMRHVVGDAIDLHCAPPTRQIFSERSKSMLRAAFFGATSNGSQGVGR